MTLTQRMIGNLKSELRWAEITGKLERKAWLESEIARLEIEEREAMRNTDELVERMKW